MVEKVFFALEGSGTDKKIDWPYVLISAATLWAGKRFKQFKPHRNVKEIFLDSGGFSFFYRSGDYEFYPAQFIRLARKINADYVAVMDYPCEPDVNRSKLRTNYERIDKTIENAIKLMDLADDINWVMVVQGYKPEEYLYAIDRIKEQGLLTDLMAIGSLCVRKSISSAREIILLVRKNLPSRIKLHGFGVDLRFLRDLAIFSALYSTDTAAWKWNNRAHWAPDWQPKGFMPKSEADKLKNFEKYKKKVLDVLEYMKAQTYWDEHWFELIPELGEGL